MTKLIREVASCDIVTPRSAAGALQVRRTVTPTHLHGSDWPHPLIPMVAQLIMMTCLTLPYLGGWGFKPNLNNPTLELAVAANHIRNFADKICFMSQGSAGQSVLENILLPCKEIRCFVLERLFPKLRDHLSVSTSWRLLGAQTSPKVLPILSLHSPLQRTHPPSLPTAIIVTPPVPHLIVTLLIWLQNLHCFGQPTIYYEMHAIQKANMKNGSEKEKSWNKAGIEVEMTESKLACCTETVLHTNGISGEQGRQTCYSQLVHWHPGRSVSAICADRSGG
ncbi:hypothetical protein KSP39_PZI003955 [Platanthera zijinensis]|uniref:Uncharacterized protein n=1 Tax=Platanthera zijinensis TaxID=2320716 RepID=A0AAP0GCQ6_9ASPA